MSAPVGKARAVKVAKAARALKVALAGQVPVRVVAATNATTNGKTAAITTRRVVGTTVVTEATAVAVTVAIAGMAATTGMAATAAAPATTRSAITKGCAGADQARRAVPQGQAVGKPVAAAPGQAITRLRKPKGCAAGQQIAAVMAGCQRVRAQVPVVRVQAAHVRVAHGQTLA